MSADAFFQKLWYERSWNLLSMLFLPLSWLFGAVIALRRLAFRCGIVAGEKVSRPVIVVGNITAGGTGKTPLTLWLAEQLCGKGFRPGIILRGYRGNSPSWPRDATPDSDPAEVGDEAVLLARLSRGIVVAGPDRVAAARRAIDLGADVILADDGLQHYRLARDIEIAVVDAGRGIGNGRLLPAGPLREGVSRLQQVDVVAVRAGLSPVAETWSKAVRGKASSVISFVVRATGVRSLHSGKVLPLAAFQGQLVHVVCGIGNPEGFFATLRESGIAMTTHTLPDHATITSADLSFGDAAPVLMTEKDAVKCKGFDDARLWAVTAQAEIEAGQAAILMSIVETCIASYRSSPHRQSQVTNR